MQNPFQHQEQKIEVNDNDDFTEVEKNGKASTMRSTSAQVNN